MITVFMSEPALYEDYKAWRDSFMPNYPDVTIADAQVALGVNAIIFSAYTMKYTYDKSTGKNSSLVFALERAYAHRRELTPAEIPREQVKPRAGTCTECGAIVFYAEVFQRGHKEGCVFNG